MAAWTRRVWAPYGVAMTTDYRIFLQSRLLELVEGLARTGEPLRSKAMSFGKDGGTAGGDRMHNAVCIAVSAESWLLNFWELPQEILIGACCLDDLVGGSQIFRGESSWNGVRLLCCPRDGRSSCP